MDDYDPGNVVPRAALEAEQENSRQGWRIVQEASDERDALRQLVHDLWAAWNDGTIELHNLLIARGDAPDLPVLDLSPKQQTLLDETIRWVHNWTAEQLGDG